MRKKLMLITMLTCFLMSVSCNNKNIEKNANDNIGNNIEATENSEEKITITTTIFPLYDMTKTILGDNIDKFNINILLKSGLDLHNFQPSVKDIDTISNSDIFIYIGGESDERWVDRVIDTADNKNLININLMDEMSDLIKLEELKPGMMEEEHEHGEEDEEQENKEKEEGHEEEHEHEKEYDEHIWLSLINAKRISKIILDNVCSLDSSNTMKYIENYNNFIDTLNALNEEYIKTINSSKKKVLLFGDRFPFRYLVDDYGLDYYAAFKGCSAETEASFETISFLTEKLNELDLNTVIVLDGSNKKIAETIIENSNNKDRKILVLNSMQSINDKDIKSGATYIKIMEDNLKILKEALN